MAGAIVDMAGWSAEERAYSLWLRTAKENAGSAAALVRKIILHLEKTQTLQYAPEEWISKPNSDNGTNWSSRTINRWESGQSPKRQPQQPSNEWLRSALVAVVTDLVPDPPSERAWSSFQEVSDAFDAQRKERQERGGKKTEPRAVQERNAERHHFLAIQPTVARKIDPVKLGLGSWVYKNNLPPYVSRTADMELAVRLETPGITTIVGAPKSGKSRSIIEVLRRNHPESLIWWVNPTSGVLPVVVENAQKVSRTTETPVFMVLDDAGLFGTDPQFGITAQRIIDLSNACKNILIVIHEETLASWEHRLSHRVPDGSDSQVIGVSHELLDLLNADRISYDSSLNEDEIPRAEEIYGRGNLESKSFGLLRIAEAFAGVQTLLHKAQNELKNPVSIGACLIEAAIDASIAFPAGASLEVLEALAKTHYHKRQPNRLWRRTLLEDAFDNLTTGITTDSPHAILITSSYETYRLLDALVPLLRQSNRSILEILEKCGLEESTFSLSMFAAGSWLYDSDFRDLAKRAWENSALTGNLDAMNSLGVLEKESGHLDEARRWWTQAANNGQSEAMIHLGFLEWKTHNTDEARKWWTQAANNGNTLGGTLIGVLESKVGNTDEARKWLTQAASNGSSEAMVNLGALESKVGNSDEARKWWIQAAKTKVMAFVQKGAESTENQRKLIIQSARTMAMVNLGILEYKVGNIDEARKWWTKSTHIGHPEAIFNLGVLEKESGRLNEAHKLWIKAANKGFIKAMRNLGLHEAEMGNIEAARTWYTQAAATGDTRAMHSLGFIEHQEGNIEAARTWYTQAAAAGDTHAINNLRILLKEAENERNPNESSNQN